MRGIVIGGAIVVLASAAAGRHGAQAQERFHAMANETRVVRGGGAMDTAARAAGGARERPGQRRLVLSPDASPLPAWGGYVAVHDLFFASAAVGIGGLVTLSGGASAAPWLDRQYYAVSPAITLAAGNDLAFSAGAAWFGGGDRDGPAAIATGSCTIGRGAGSATLGAGWGLSGEDIAGRPVFLVGFRAPFADGVQVVGENRFTAGFDPALLSLALRYSPGSVSVDLGAIFVSRGDGGPAPLLPWFSTAFDF